MLERKNLHRPISVVIDGSECTLLTIGYMAAALHRTTWTIHYWERLGLLPSPPFVINPERLRTKRHLYPEAFVAEITEIAKHYSSRRLEREQWRTFQMEARQVYSRTVEPLLPPGVITPLAVTAAPR